MRLLLKTTIKNILKKPFRSLLIMFCVAICSLSAMLCFDMTNSIENMIRGLYSSMLGDVDIMVSAYEIEDDFLEDEMLSDCTVLPVFQSGNSFYRKIDDEYAYVHQVFLSIYGLNMDSAYALGVIPSKVDISDDEVILSNDFSEEFGYNVGDTIIFTDNRDNDVEFTVADVIDYEGKGFAASYSGVITTEAAKKLDAMENTTISIAMISIPDKTKTFSLTNYLNEKYPSYDITSLYENEDFDEITEQITKLFFILFAVCVFMVIFVTISISERIVAERMAVIGTLRSIGLSPSLTAFSLLLENGLYGLIGSFLGCRLYAVIRNVILGSMISTTLDFDITFGDVKPILYVLVILSAILVECLCPIKEIIKAVNTPIRDIIFSNKDTEYKHSKIGTIVGILMVVIAIVLVFVPATFASSLVLFAAIVIALALLFPYVLRFIGKYTAALFEKMNLPVARLAIVEACTKKSSVGSSVLIATAISLVIVVFSVSKSLESELDTVSFTSDVIVITNQTETNEKFSYIQDIDGVEKVEYLYMGVDSIICGDNEKDSMIYVTALPEEGFEYFKIVEGLDEAINDNEIILDEGYAERHGVNVGETVHFTFNLDGFIPVDLDLTVKKLVDGTYFDGTGDILFINQKLFDRMYSSYPAYILIGCEDSVTVDALIEKYSSDYVSMCYTYDEYREYEMNEASSVIAVINFAMFLGITLSFIGAVSNLLIGFEGRKRESAVLCSTAMSKSKLSGMLFKESMFLSGVSLIIGLPLGILMTLPIARAMDAINASIEIVTTPLQYLGIALVMWIVFSLTSLFPRRILKKMNLATQLKYE